MLVVWSARANGHPSLYGMSEMEETAEKTKWRVRPTRYQVAASAREEMAWQLIGKRAGNWPNIAVFEKHRGGQQGWNKGEGA